MQYKAIMLIPILAMTIPLVHADDHPIDCTISGTGEEIQNSILETVGFMLNNAMLSNNMESPANIKMTTMYSDDCMDVFNILGNIMSQVVSSGTDDMRDSDNINVLKHNMMVGEMMMTTASDMAMMDEMMANINMMKMNAMMEDEMEKMMSESGKDLTKDTMMETSEITCTIKGDRDEIIQDLYDTLDQMFGVMRMSPSMEKEIDAYSDGCKQVFHLLGDTMIGVTGTDDMMMEKGMMGSKERYDKDGMKDKTMNKMKDKMRDKTMNDKDGMKDKSKYKSNDYAEINMAFKKHINDINGILSDYGFLTQDQLYDIEGINKARVNYLIGQYRNDLNVLGDYNMGVHLKQPSYLVISTEYIPKMNLICQCLPVMSPTNVQDLDMKLSNTAKWFDIKLERLTDDIIPNIIN